MNKIYTYIAKNTSGTVTNGLIVAASEASAIAILRQRGLQPMAVDFSLNDTVASLTTPNFAPEALASYYMGLGLRIKNGMDILDSVSDMKDQPSQFLVKLCAMELVNYMRAGLKLGIAMEKAGFPARDCSIIQALEQGAKTASGFDNIAKDYQRTAGIQKKINGMLLEPTFMAVVGVMAIWATMVFGVPIFQRVFKEIASAGAKIPAYARLFYAFSDLFDAHVVLDSVLYFGGIIALAIFLRSRYFKKLLDQISTLRKFSEMVDNAALWGGFRLLIDTSIGPERIPGMLSKGAHRQDSRDAFQTLGMMVARGEKYPAAIRRSGFPEYIGKDAASAMDAPGIVAQTEALTMMNNILAMRVEEMAEKVVKLSHILTTVGAGVMIFTIIMLTFMPVLITELHMA